MLVSFIKTYAITNRTRYAECLMQINMIYYNKKHNVIDYNKPLYLMGGSHFMKIFQKQACCSEAKR